MDLSAAQLVLDVCTADGDATTATSPEDLTREWKAPGFELERDAWVVEIEEGRIVDIESEKKYPFHTFGTQSE